MTKVSTNTPRLMRSSRVSLALQLLISLCGIAAVVCHSIQANDAAVYTSSVLLVLISVVSAFSNVIDFVALRLLLRSFRGLGIVCSCCVYLVCNILGPILAQQFAEPILTVCINNMSWSISIFLLMCADTVPSITNPIRLFGPLLVTANNVYLCLKITEYDVTLFSLYSGSITLNDIEVACKIQVILFGFTYIWGVPRDPTHEYFVLLDDAVLVESMLPNKHRCTDDHTTVVSFCGQTYTLRTVHIFHCLALLTSLQAVLYIINSILKDQVAILALSCCLYVLALALALILLVKGLEWKVLKRLVLQYRFNMISMSVLALLFCGVQKMLWETDASFIVQSFLDHVAFTTCIMFFVLRDAMNVAYPNYFVLLIAIILLLVSGWNLFVVTFEPRQPFMLVASYPEWFIVLNKQAFGQVAIACVLCTYYLVVDPDHRYFVLIRNRKKTKDLWADTEGGATDAYHLLQNENLTDEL